MLTYPFPTPFEDEIINEVVGDECYSFIDGFLGYIQMLIEKEDQHKTTFVCAFGSFSYRVNPFEPNNSPSIFSRIVIKAFNNTSIKIWISTSTIGPYTVYLETTKNVFSLC